jgi:hypothetical protein
MREPRPGGSHAACTRRAIVHSTPRGDILRLRAATKFPELLCLSTKSDRWYTSCVPFLQPSCNPFPPMPHLLLVDDDPEALEWLSELAKA